MPENLPYIFVHYSFINCFTFYVFLCTKSFISSNKTIFYIQLGFQVFVGLLCICLSTWRKNPALTALRFPPISLLSFQVRQTSLTSQPMYDSITIGSFLNQYREWPYRTCGQTLLHVIIFVCIIMFVK